MGMYESPIKIIESTIDSIYKDIVKKKDDAIFAEIQSSFGVDLDRDELIRALQYDRDQYNKGYDDGKRDAMAELVRCENCIYRSQYADENGNYKCGGILTEDEETALMVKPDFFCAYGERKDNG